MTSFFDWKDYQEQAYSFAVFKDPDYPMYALAEECGELIGKFAKQMRGDNELNTLAVLQEIGDILWNVAVWRKLNFIKMTVPYVSLRNMKEAEELPLNGIALSVLLGFCRGEPTHALMSLSLLAKRLGSSLEGCATLNLEKLTDRKARFVIRGTGDNR